MTADRIPPQGRYWLVFLLARAAVVALGVCLSGCDPRPVGSSSGDLSHPSGPIPAAGWAKVADIPINDSGIYVVRYDNREYLVVKEGSQVAVCLVPESTRQKPR